MTDQNRKTKEKKAVRIIAFAILFIMLCSFKIFSENTVKEDGFTAMIEREKADALSCRYGKSNLSNESQRYIYNRIRESVKERKTLVEFNNDNYRITYKNYIVARQAVLRDFPEYYWYEGRGSIYGNGIGSGNSKIITMATFKYISTTEKKQKNFTKKVNRIVNSIPDEYDTQYLKALYLHDWLCENVTYGEGDNQQNAYGALIDGVCVCEGYSKAYKILLQKAGITSWIVNGTAYNSDFYGSHSWNLIELKGKCYYTDVCWDDSGEYIRYSYFMRDRDTMDEDHWVEQETNDYLSAYMKKCIPEKCGHENMDVVSQGAVGKSISIEDDELTVENVVEAFGNEYLDDKGMISRSAVLKIEGEYESELITEWVKENCRDIAKAMGISLYSSFWYTCETLKGLTTITISE